MSILHKALKVAGQLTRQGQLTDATATIRAALSGLTGTKTDAAGHPPQDESWFCMAKAGPMPDLSALRRGRQGQPRPASSPGAVKANLDETHFVTRSIAGPWGSRTYKLFLPATDKPCGLIVMLHGCSQNPDDFAAGTRMNDVADRHDCLVAYPEQTRSSNMSGCWNWFDPRDQSRDKGEPALIAAITREVMGQFDVAPANVFVAGLSAGGAMAAIMAETYPDLYAGAGIHSGLSYGAATSMPGAFSAMSGSPQGSTREARPTGRGVPVIVFHGDADRTVHPVNGETIVARFSAGETALRPVAERGTAPGGQTFERIIGRDQTGDLRFEHWIVNGAGHAWSGGSRDGSYTDPAGPDASSEMMRFFLEQGKSRTGKDTRNKITSLV